MTSHRVLLPARLILQRPHGTMDLLSASSRHLQGSSGGTTQYKGQSRAARLIHHGTIYVILLFIRLCNTLTKCL